MLAYVLYLLYKNVLSLSLIHAQPCPMKSWHLCDTSTAAICPLDFSVSQRYVQIKDQGSDIPTQTFLRTSISPRAVELGICKDSRRGLGILSTLTCNRLHMRWSASESALQESKSSVRRHFRKRYLWHGFANVRDFLVTHVPLDEFW